MAKKEVAVKNEAGLPAEFLEEMALDCWSRVKRNNNRRFSNTVFTCITKNESTSYQKEKLNI